MNKELSCLISRRIKNQVKKNFCAILPQPYVLYDEIPAGKKFPNSLKGGAIFTADFELAWAVRFSKQKSDPLVFARRERDNVPIILETAERFNIPITWATVGHLFLESCKKGDHDWMARLPYMDDHWRYVSGDWFDSDPYSSVNEAPEWYAPDLIKTILGSKVGHEIACHTFSHIDCSDQKCPPKVLDDELTACEMAAKEWGISFSSMAFPGGTAGNFAVLRDHGIRIYRRRIGKYELAYPFRDAEGLLVSPTGPSIGMSHEGWTAKDEFAFLKKSIDKAIRHNTLAHMWFHPSASRDTFTDLLPLIMDYCSSKREDGELWIGTMNGLQKHINGSGVI